MSLISWVWHVRVHVCMLTYIYTHMSSAALGKDCVWLKGSRGALDRVARHIRRPSSFGVSVGGMLCLVDADAKVFWASTRTDYSLDPRDFLAPAEGLRRAYIIVIIVV